MALIDSRGRLFGRINVIDAAVAVVLLVAIPLIYAAFVLFRQPEPGIVSISPATLTPRVARVQIKGRNLRPFLRVSFNNEQGTTFAFVDAETAEVDVPALTPGTYDVILYDVAREVGRLANALTVEGPPVPPSTEARMLVAGRFVALDDATAREIRDGVKLSAMGGNRLEVIARREATADRRWFLFSGHQIEAPLSAGLQVPALLRVNCSTKDRRCQVGGSDVEAGLSLAVFTEAGRPIRFEMSDAVSDGASSLVELRIRFVVPTESVGTVKSGDRAQRDPLLGDRVPALVAVEGARPAPARINLPPATGLGAGEWALEITDTMSTLDATVRVRGDETSQGLQYRGRPLRAGAPFVFEHEQYVLRGWIRSMNVLPGASK
jgi:hypothetical protein